MATWGGLFYEPCCECCRCCATIFAVRSSTHMETMSSAAGASTDTHVDGGDILPLLRRSPVIPVVTLARPEDAVPLARALLAGGIGIIEVTFRSDAAVSGIEAIRRECPTIAVGAGTVWTAQQAVQASS